MFWVELSSFLFVRIRIFIAFSIVGFFKKSSARVVVGGRFCLFFEESWGGTFGSIPLEKHIMNLMHLRWCGDAYAWYGLVLYYASISAKYHGSYPAEWVE